MVTRDPQGTGIITLSYIAVLLLAILPLPHFALWFRPAWVAMILIYWSMALPNRVGLGSAFSLGIILDVLNATLLGEHAFGLILVVYLALKFHRQIRVFPVVQQAVCVFMLVFLYRFILLLFQGMIGALPNLWLFWFPALTSMLLWPWVYYLLRNWRRRYRIV